MSILAAQKEHERMLATKRKTTKKWGLTHPEKRRASDAAWYAANTAKVHAKNTTWRAAHPERVHTWAHTWMQAHPEHAALLATARIARRRARLRGVAINDATAAQRKLVLDTAKGHCEYCTFYDPGCKRCPKGAHTDLTVDHITAVYHRGNHTLHNFVACCRLCNSKKGTRPNPVPVQPLLL